MKYKFMIFLGALALASTGCKDENAKYVDLNTGAHLNLVKDGSTGLMVDADSKRPVYIYVDTETKDTIYGKTGKVINGEVMRHDGRYEYAEYTIKMDEDEYKIKSADYKQKVEKDGDIKIKDGDAKLKIDGETGEAKVK